MKLKELPIHFDSENHVYTNTVTGRELKGITSTLMRRLFPKKYEGIPQYILDNAARKGTAVHNEIECAEEFSGEFTTVQGENYRKMRDEYKLKFLTSEYCVSDLANYASKIDLVFEEDDNSVSIADIKTTSSFDKESVSWQLSIYAYLFSLSNPDIKIKHLYGIWVREKDCSLIEVRLHSYDEVERLFFCDINDTEFTSAENSLPDYMESKESRLYTLAREIKELTWEYDKLKAELVDEMYRNGDKCIDTGRMIVTYMGSQSRMTLDTKRLKQERGEIYNRYIKETVTKPSVKITIKN